MASVMVVVVNLAGDARVGVANATKQRSDWQCA